MYRRSIVCIDIKINILVCSQDVSLSAFSKNREARILLAAGIRGRKTKAANRSEISIG